LDMVLPPALLNKKARKFQALNFLLAAIT